MVGDNGLVKHETVDALDVRVYADRGAMGAAAARDVAATMRDLLATQVRVRMIFAAAPSQNEFLAALSDAPMLDWSRVTAFHMDEYLGLPLEAPQRFGTFLRAHLFDAVHPGVVHFIDSTNETATECARYGALLRAAPIDIVCLGIGENGHIAFNDPPVADFDDPEAIKPVELDPPCKRQQVNDGCFATIGDVPNHALTLTIPMLLSGAYLSCVVPGSAKRRAVHDTLRGPITTACPASILRHHPACKLYLDRDAAGA
ncbi:MAG: glucosamine-6-phosphate deaminase [Chloroflexota bacterium]|nr:glucosamine-6-phosphate deaminase [Chloroflexota bacterium]